MKLFDSHCHLTWADDQYPVEEWLQQAHANQVEQFICVAVDEKNALECKALADIFPQVHPTFGIHPNDLGDGSELAARLQTLNSLAKETGWVAVGETGMDFFREQTTREVQEEGFSFQLELAKEWDLSTVIHCRDAADATLAILKNHGNPERCIMHCWSGSPDELKPFLDLGVWVSFAGNLTYPKSDAIRQSAQLVPEHRLLLETDAPFLAPQPKRGKRNEPAFLPHTLQALAEIREMSPIDLAEITYQNTCEAFEISFHSGIEADTDI